MLVTYVQLAPVPLHLCPDCVLPDAKYKASLSPRASRRWSPISWNALWPPSCGRVNTTQMLWVRVRAHLEVSLTSLGVRLSATKLHSSLTVNFTSACNVSYRKRTNNFIVIIMVFTALNIKTGQDKKHFKSFPCSQTGKYLQAALASKCSTV